MSGKTRPSQRAKVLSNVDYSNLSHTDKKFIHDMFALAESQQAEIEELNVELVGMRGACNSYKMHYDNAKAEIEKLKKLTKDRADVNFDEIVRVVDRARADIKSEAIKECIEKLKDLSYESDLYDRNERWVRAVTIDELDEAYKEMVGEQE